MVHVHVTCVQGKSALVFSSVACFAVYMLLCNISSTYFLWEVQSNLAKLHVMTV